MFTGDISFAENYVVYQNAKEKGLALTELFDEAILSQMRAADFLVVNCESAVGTGGMPLAGKAYTFLTSPETAKVFTDIGADLVGLANNHVYDFGKETFLDTLSHFASMGLPTVGAGADAAQAYAPFYYEQSGRRIAILAASRAEKNFKTPIATPDSPGIAGCYDTALMCEAVRKAKENADFVIVYAHFGAEYSTTIEKVQRQAAHDFIDAGADLIIGAHPHILQGMESYKGKAIFYSLGNYLFNLKTLDTALLEITFESEEGAPRYRIVPCVQKNGRVQETDGARILKDLAALSPDVTILEDGSVLFS
jgi:poly-gamma-glutamate synthesis protein (capsule biosynthesis protein)